MTGPLTHPTEVLRRFVEDHNPTAVNPITHPTVVLRTLAHTPMAARITPRIIGLLRTTYYTALAIGAVGAAIGILTASVPATVVGFSLLAVGFDLAGLDTLIDAERPDLNERAWHAIRDLFRRMKGRL